MITVGKLQAFARALVNLRDSASDEIALQNMAAFDEWESGVEYKEGNRVQYNDLLYKYISPAPSVSQSTWTPDVTPSLWVRIDDPSVEYPEWRQPLGATDAYPMGAKVSYNGKHWISTYDNNIWVPGTFGWDEVT